MRTIYGKAGAEHRSVKDVVNEILEYGLHRASGKKEVWECPSYDLGGARFDYAKTWNLVDTLEADATAEKMELRK